MSDSSVKKTKAGKLPRSEPVRGPTGLVGFYRSQKKAIAEARAIGVDEFIVTVRPNKPGATDILMTMTLQDFANLRTLAPDPGSGASYGDLRPSKALQDAMTETRQVRTFYKTADELFCALETQDQE